MEEEPSFCCGADLFVKGITLAGWFGDIPHTEIVNVY